MQKEVRKGGRERERQTLEKKREESSEGGRGKWRKLSNENQHTCTTFVRFQPVPDSSFNSSNNPK